MKNILKRLPKKVFAAVVGMALVAGIASQALAGFGPNRPTRVWNAQENGFDYVTFNSYTGVPNGIGDERDFYRGSIVGPNAGWVDPVTNIPNNAEVEMKIYVHNNANPALNESGAGVAKNVTVRAQLPTGLSQDYQSTAYISADNAQPQQIFDTVNLTGANGAFMGYEYMPGTARMFDHETGQTTTLSDTLVTTGVNIGDQKGCFKYMREITFRVRAKMPDYRIQKVARIKGEGSDKWRQNVNAKVGDEIQWRIWFAAGGTANLSKVALVDDLPSFTTVVGSVEMDKGANTIVYGPEAVQENGTFVHIDMGDFHPGDDAYVYFTTKIENAKEIECGAHKIINNAYITPQGLGAVNDKASVTIVNEDCEPEKPSYICEAVTVEKIGGRKVRVTVKAPGSNGAVLKNATINYGDGSQAKVTNNLVNGNIVDEYEYKADGTYKISASVIFTVDGKDKSVTSDACTAMVTFKGETPPELPKTGTGSLIGLFTIVTLAVAVAHNVISRRVA